MGAVMGDALGFPCLVSFTEASLTFTSDDGIFKKLKILGFFSNLLENLSLIRFYFLVRIG